jgi:hypothetical protein
MLRYQFEVRAGQRRDAHCIRRHAYRLHRDLARKPKHFSEHTLEPGVIKRRCQELRSAIVTVLAHLGNEHLRPAPGPPAQGPDAPARTAPCLARLEKYPHLRPITSRQRASLLCG